MRGFSYIRAASLDEVKQALTQYGDESRLIAGGQSLLNMMKMRIVSPAYLISVGDITSLKGYQYQPDGSLEIGAAATYSTLQSAELESGAHRMIAQVSGNIADGSVRNMATAGGAVCQADPHSDFPALTVSLGAEFNLDSERGRRTVPAAQFFTDYYETNIGPDEILTTMRFPRIDANVGWAFEKFCMRQGDYALVSIACTLTADQEGKVKEAKIVIGSTEAIPVRAREAEAFLKGQVINGQCTEEAGRIAMFETQPLADSIFSSAAYKQELVKTLTQRAILTAKSRLKGWN
jgi:CO/xanthine dehydrogenase FAD-binding subunit